MCLQQDIYFILLFCCWGKWRSRWESLRGWKERKSHKANSLTLCRQAWLWVAYHKGRGGDPNGPYKSREGRAWWGWQTEQSQNRIWPAFSWNTSRYVTKPGLTPTQEAEEAMLCVTAGYRHRHRHRLLSMRAYCAVHIRFRSGICFGQIPFKSKCLLFMAYFN